MKLRRQKCQQNSKILQKQIYVMRKITSYFIVVILLI